MATKKTRRPGLGTDPLDSLLGAGEAPAKAARSSAASTPSRVEKARITFQLTAELIDRMRDTVVQLGGPPLQLTLNGLAEEAIARELERLAKKHNQGEPFPPRAGDPRPGRRIGS